MSGDAEIPPTYYFSGITFNPSFYQSSSSDYLTLATAKSSFLTYPTAQGSETFSTLNSSTINSSTINSISDTSDFNIVPLQSDGILNIGTGGRSLLGAINIGTGSTVANPITIGSNASTVDLYGTVGIKSGTLVASGGVSTTTITATGTITADGGISLPAGDAINVLGNITGSGNITTSGEISVSGSGTISTATNGSIKSNAYESRTTTTNMTIGATMTDAANIIIGANSLIKVKSPAITYAGLTQAATFTNLYGGLMYANVSAAYTIPSNINREFYLVITGATKTITMPALTIHQIINIKVFSAQSMNLTTPLSTTQFYPKTGGSATNIYPMPADSTQTFYCDGTNWYGY